MNQCLICEGEVSVLDASPVDNLIHSSCWAQHLKEKEEPISCPVCFKPVLIVYKDHPALHSLCVLKWKSQHKGEELPPPTRPETDIGGLLQKLKQARKEQEERKTTKLFKADSKVFFSGLASQKRFQAALNPEFPRINPNNEEVPTIRANGTEEIARILDCQENYFHVLCVSRNFQIETLTHNYRKIALLVHPDKNSDTNAEVAFKLVSTAFTCLKDPETKAQYEKFGTKGLDPRYQEEAIIFANKMKALLIIELSNSIQNLLSSSSVLNVFNQQPQQDQGKTPSPRGFSNQRNRNFSTGPNEKKKSEWNW